MFFLFFVGGVFGDGEQPVGCVFGEDHPGVGDELLFGASCFDGFGFGDFAFAVFHHDVDEHLVQGPVEQFPLFAEPGIGYDLFQFGEGVLGVEDGVEAGWAGVDVGGYHRDAGDERWRCFLDGYLVGLSGPVVVGSEGGYEGVVPNEFSCFAFVGGGVVSGLGAPISMSG
jgi:hypothetical protein